MGMCYMCPPPVKYLVLVVFCCNKQNTRGKQLRGTMFIVFWLTASEGPHGHLTLCLHWWVRGEEGRQKRKGGRRLTGHTPRHLVTYVVWGPRIPNKPSGRLSKAWYLHMVSLCYWGSFTLEGGDWTPERICSLFTSDSPVHQNPCLGIRSDMVIAVLKWPTVGHGRDSQVAPSFSCLLSFGLAL